MVHIKKKKKNLSLFFFNFLQFEISVIRFWVDLQQKLS